MGKQINSNDTEATIKDCFTKNKEAKKLHVTSDGQCFLENALGAAERHSRISKLDLKTVNREDYVDAPKVEVSAPVTEVADEVAEATDLDPKYGKMKLDELKAACTSREIAFDDATAKRKDLILLLEQADAATK